MRSNVAEIAYHYSGYNFKKNIVDIVSLFKTHYAVHVPKSCAPRNRLTLLGSHSIPVLHYLGRGLPQIPRCVF